MLAPLVVAARSNAPTRPAPFPVAGSSAVVALLASVGTAWCSRPGSPPPVAGAAPSRFTPDLRARQRNDIVRDFIALEQELVRTSATPERMGELKARPLQIEATEPILRVLDAMESASGEA